MYCESNLIITAYVVSRHFSQQAKNEEYIPSEKQCMHAHSETLF